MPPTDDADDLVLDQRGQVQVVGRRRPIADHDVEIALCEGVLIVETRTQRVDDQSRVRRLTPHALDDAGQEHHREEVWRADPEREFRPFGLEALAFDKQLVDVPQDRARLVVQLEGMFGRGQASLVEREQRVLEDSRRRLRC